MGTIKNVVGALLCSSLALTCGNAFSAQLMVDNNVHLTGGSFSKNSETPAIVANTSNGGKHWLLETSGDLVLEDNTAGENVYNIKLEEEGKLNIRGSADGSSSIVITGSSAKNIYGTNVSTTSSLVVDNMDVNIIGNTALNKGTLYGIHNMGNLSINGSQNVTNSINIINNEADMIYGIYSTIMPNGNVYPELNINNMDINISGNKVGFNLVGFYAYGDLNITGNTDGLIRLGSIIILVINILPLLVYPVRQT